MQSASVPRQRPTSPRIVQQLEISDVVRDQDLFKRGCSEEEVIITGTCQTDQTGSYGGVP